MEQVGRRGNKRDDRKGLGIHTGVVNKRGVMKVLNLYAYKHLYICLIFLDYGKGKV